MITQTTTSVSYLMDHLWNYRSVVLDIPQSFNDSTRETMDELIEDYLSLCAIASGQWEEWKPFDVVYNSILSS